MVPHRRDRDAGAGGHVAVTRQTGVEDDRQTITIGVVVTEQSVTQESPAGEAAEAANAAPIEAEGMDVPAPQVASQTGADGAAPEEVSHKHLRKPSRRQRPARRPGPSWTGPPRRQGSTPTGPAGGPAAVAEAAGDRAAVHLGAGRGRAAGRGDHLTLTVVAPPAAGSAR